MKPGETDVFYCRHCGLSRSKEGREAVRNRAGAIVRWNCASCAAHIAEALRLSPIERDQDRARRQP